MQNYQSTPLQSNIRTFALIFLSLAFIPTLYAAFAVKTSLPQLVETFPVLELIPQSSDIDMSALSTLRMLTIFAAIIYCGAAVVLYLKRNTITTTVLCTVAIISAALVIIDFTQLNAFGVPVSYSYNEDNAYVTIYRSMYAPKTLLPYAVISVIGVISALLAAFDARLTKRTLRALGSTNNSYGKDLRKAKTARVLAVITVVITLSVAILAFIYIADNSDCIAKVKEYIHR